MKILIDGDSCPVLDMTIVLGALLGMAVVVFSTMENHTRNKGIEHVRCKSGKDSVDYNILKQATVGDIVVTQDQGLASLCLVKGAKAINEYGFSFSKQFFLEKNIYICLRKGKQPSRLIKDDLDYINGFLDLVALKIAKKEQEQRAIYLDNPSKAVRGIALAIGRVLDYPVKIITRRQEFHRSNPDCTVYVEDSYKKEEEILPYMKRQDIVVTKDTYLAFAALQNGAAVMCENNYIYKLEDFEITYQRGENILINRYKQNFLHEEKFLATFLSHCSPFSVGERKEPLLPTGQEAMQSLYEKERRHS